MGSVLSESRTQIADTGGAIERRGLLRDAAGNLSARVTGI
jgi:hypothetical protein